MYQKQFVIPRPPSLFTTTPTTTTTTLLLLQATLFTGRRFWGPQHTLTVPPNIHTDTRLTVTRFLFERSTRKKRKRERKNYNEWNSVLLSGSHQNIGSLGPGALTRSGGGGLGCIIYTFVIYICFLEEYDETAKWNRKKEEEGRGLMSSSPGKITLTSLPRRLSCRFSPLHHRQPGLSRLATIPPPPPVCVYTHLWKHLEMPMSRPEFSHSFFLLVLLVFLLLSRKERTGCAVLMFSCNSQRQAN